MKLFWTRSARRELRELMLYIAERDPLAAVRVVDRIEDSLGMLAEFPRAGRPGKVLGTRELVIDGTPFLIAYRIQDRHRRIEILAVKHGAQRWPSEFD